MRIVLLGAPGAGKGTQAVKLSEKLKVPHISTGDIFRYNIKNNTPLGKMAKEYMDKGALVPDEVTIGIVKERLAQEDCSNGFILDGFPRTIPQAESLDAVLSEMGAGLDYAVDIFVPDTEIIKRLSGRRVCPACSISYHIQYGPPKKDGICDGCGASLIQREDDRETTVLNRLETYHMQTEPLIGYYKGKGRLLVVEGQDKISDTTVEMLKVLGIK
ncbi:MAG: adenylate kinase [Clostridiales bacterium GWC2_40_7]|nr:MAG: adenylate kinase [Clostridiales bacterium GWC2_40_7]